MSRAIVHRPPIEIEMSDVASTLRLFAIAVLISFSLAVGTAAVGTTMRAQAAAPVGDDAAAAELARVS